MHEHRDVSHNRGSGIGKRREIVGFAGSPYMDECRMDEGQEFYFLNYSGNNSLAVNCYINPI